MPIYNKLVRDRIPEIIDKSGKGYMSRLLNDGEYLVELKRKLHEEIDEYDRATSDQEALEELSDILELIHSLAKLHGTTIETVEKLRGDKADKRGGFDQKVFLIEVDDG